MDRREYKALKEIMHTWIDMLKTLCENRRCNECPYRDYCRVAKNEVNI